MINILHIKSHNLHILHHIYIYIYINSHYIIDKLYVHNKTFALSKFPFHFSIAWNMQATSQYFKSISLFKRKEIGKMVQN